MTITISTQDPRSLKAISIAAEAGQWAKCWTRDGRKVYGVPSQHDPNVRYLADLHQCSCPDFQRRGQPCKHILAIRLHCTLVQVQAQQRPKEVVAESEPYAF
jgi:predicted nucleic acid-binding Zn finger protein